MASPAMRCPRGSAAMPAASCTATRGAMYSPRPTTAVKNELSGNCLIQSPQALGSSSGMTKYQRKSCISSGTLRKISI